MQASINGGVHSADKDAAENETLKATFGPLLRTMADRFQIDA